MVAEGGRLQLECGRTLLSPNLLSSDLHQLPPTCFSQDLTPYFCRPIPWETDKRRSSSQPDHLNIISHNPPGNGPNLHIWPSFSLKIMKLGLWDEVLKPEPKRLKHRKLQNYPIQS